MNKRKGAFECSFPFVGVYCAKPLKCWVLSSHHILQPLSQRKEDQLFQKRKRKNEEEDQPF